ncbi:MAG TPA: flagellar biosynthesis protein FlgD [Planctomycetaceae bacterium]|nr:flagellar biosynthesis protein FlgD [Planctomycetaceae bacterium]HRF01406.1 flagellar hook capping FlgD N-terminal domain-containing protein [Pirellulaceae bacterium]
MAAISSGIGASSSRTGQASSAFAEVNTDDFLMLMITELQNQDPLDPTDNAEFLQQITQIRQIGANDKLTSTLDQVLAGQNLTMAAGMIGKTVTGVDDANADVTGTVDRIAFEATADGSERELRVYVGNRSFRVDRLRQITD